MKRKPSLIGTGKHQKAPHRQQHREESYALFLHGPRAPSASRGLSWTDAGVRIRAQWHKQEYAPVLVTDPLPISEENAVWRDVLEELRFVMTPENFNTWLAPTRVIVEQSDVLQVAVPKLFHKSWLEQKLAHGYGRPWTAWAMPTCALTM